jgi:hypothetical protein
VGVGEGRVGVIEGWISNGTRRKLANNNSTNDFVFCYYGPQ